MAVGPTTIRASSRCRLSPVVADPQQGFEFIGGGNRPIARTQAGADGSCSVSVRWVLQERSHRAPDLPGRRNLGQNPPCTHGGYGLPNHRLIEQAVHWQDEQRYPVGEGAHRGRVTAVAMTSEADGMI